MKKLILPIVVFLVAVMQMAAQKPKGLERKPVTPRAVAASRAVEQSFYQKGAPEIDPVFQQTREIKSLPAFPSSSQKIPDGFTVLAYDNGMPSMIEGTNTISNLKGQSLAARATQYLDVLKSVMDIKNPADEFEVKNIDNDEVGQAHVRMQQKYNGIPVWGSEVIVHEKQGRIELMNGNYFPTPSLAKTTPTVLQEAAENTVKTDLETKGSFKVLDENSKKYIEGGEQFRSELVIFHVEDKTYGEKLVWHVTSYSDMLHRHEYFVDAENGKVLNSYGSSCNLVGHLHLDGEKPIKTATETTVLTEKGQNTDGTSRNNREGGNEAENLELPLADGKTVATSTDLFDLTRTINTYQVATKYYLIDASRSMFNATNSTMPNKPVGVIQTFDYKNTDDGPAYYISSTTNTWTDKKGVSAHYNSGKTFEYFLSTHGRNSLNGTGGNIESFINVTDGGAQMDNAYWNGEAMFYGNGKDVFASLPKALDVAGHEISHGVVQNTANLRYQGESGAMNESFADIFGAMIDRDDWKMGEDIIKDRVTFPTGALRDLSNPNNGGTSFRNASYQPNHYNARYTGTEDEGGVHLNSGITNYAFYLFANNAAVGKDKAEKVYYRALSKYLVASSKFIDLRAAVEQCCKDLYPTETALLTAAQNAFTQVGIGTGGSTTGTTYQKDIPGNGGTDWVVYVTEDKSKLILTTPTNAQPTVLYTGGVASRPSVTDDGTLIVFIGTDKKMRYVSINWATGLPTQGFLNQEPIWSNVAVSKDGRKIAANYADLDSIIWVYNFDTKLDKEFVLYNPTTSTSAKKSNEVRYSDALEWDPFGEYIVYDAFNQPKSADGEVLDYWDVGFINVWSNTTKAFATGTIQKLFSNLPKGTSIGDPTFAKNSPYIVAYDVFEESPLLGTKYFIYGANIQTNKVTVDASASLRGIVTNNEQGYPCFSRLDNRLLYTAKSAAGPLQLRSIALAADKITGAAGVLNIVSDANKGNWFGNAKRVISGTNDLDKTQVQISPNPFSDVLSIYWSSEKSSKGQAEIFDLLGRRVLNTPVSLSTGDNVISIETRNLQAGAYLLKISVGNNTLTSKVVKL
jgi:bacillolysin